MLFNPIRVSENIKVQLLNDAKNYVLQAELGFAGAEKFWCKQAYKSMILEALSSPLWLNKEFQNSLLNIYNLIEV